MRGRIPQVAQRVHPCSVAFHSIDRLPRLPALKAAPPAPQGFKLRLPTQGVPVSRSEILHPYMVDYGPFRAIPEADPQPDNHAYFSSQADPRVGICSVLSAYAVARCFQTGGLF